MKPSLRRRAEELMAKSHAEIAGHATHGVRELVAELQVHQAELEIQNEDLRRAQQELVEARDRYMALYQSVPVGCLTLDAHRAICDANVAAVAMLGGEGTELVGQRLDRFVAPEDADACYLHLRQAAETRQRLHHDVRFHRADGSQFWAVLDIIPAQLPEPVAFQITLSDITERKRAEDELARAAAELQAANGTLQDSRRAALNVMEDSVEARHQAERAGDALRASEERYRGLVEQAVDGIFVADSQGHYQDVNSAGAAMLGYSRDEVLGLSFADVIVVDEVSRLPVEVGKFAGGGVVRSEWRFRRGDGTVFPGEVVGRQLPDGRLMGILRDISERKTVQEALQQLNTQLEQRVADQTAEVRAGYETAKFERQRLYDVLETLPVYVLLMSKDYHVRFANKFFREHFGEPGGKRCYEHLLDRREPCDECEAYQALMTGEPHHWSWTGPDGHTYDTYDFPFTDADGSSMTLKMGLDITEVRQAQASLQQLNETLERRVAERTAELKSANEDLTRLNRAMIGRELRMIELKKEVNALCVRAGLPATYMLEFVEDDHA